MKNITLLLFGFVILFSSCEDYLDKRDENVTYLSEAEICADKDKLESVALRLYDCYGIFFEGRYSWEGPYSAGEGKNYGNINQLSGEVLSTRSIDINKVLIYGNWQKHVDGGWGSPDFFQSWEAMNEQIYVSNQLLDLLSGKYELDARFTEQEILQMKGEAFLFRGWAYHEINKRWGAMPYWKERLTPTTDFNVARPTLAENIEDIVTDLDSAVYYLPKVSYLDDPAYMGRFGKATAMAIKSRALTTAASPNYQPNNGSDTEMWERAATAAWDLIQLSRSTDKVGLYQYDEDKRYEMFVTLPGTCEGVVPRYYGMVKPQIYVHTWQFKSQNGSALCLSPTQELVDHFETSNGLIPEDDATYNFQNPYVNRDPRFYESILFHGNEWAKTAEGQHLDFRTEINGKFKMGSDRDAPNNADFGNTKTGYMVRKHLVPKWGTTKYNTSKYANAPYMRMAEVYLNYAEAVNEAYKSPQATAPGADLNAVEALNAIRNRAGQVDVNPVYTGGYDAFQRLVRNEFHVELCFEYHLWFDQLRWRTAHLFDQHNFHGVLIKDDATAPNDMKVRFELFEIPIDRNFDKSKHYRYPLRTSDLQINNLLEQNPGWK